MTRRFIDMTGQRYGRLTVLRESGKDGTVIMWDCQCECGNHARLRGYAIRQGKVASCGCLHKELLIARSTKHGHANSRGATPEYHTYRGMIDRCTNPNNRGYAHYGGRGIKLCDRWMNSFEAFLEDMGPKAPGMSIERVDVNGDYCPSNCVWLERRKQNRNKRCTRRVTAFGTTMLLVEWSQRLGLQYETIRDRIGKLGWSPERALTQPPKKRSVKA